MRLSVCFLLVVALVALSSAKWHKKKKKTKAYDGLTDTEKISRLEKILDGLSRQVMLQQFFSEEHIRTNGDSGVKAIRANMDGIDNYFETGVTEWAFLAMHNHPNFDRTVGLGELNVVMNGVDFRTRHNDYKLRMPATNSSEYNAMEDIPFTEVPPSVLNQTTIEGQVAEMQEYFRAFKTQNVTHRDYRPYFKPVLCYLEGGWTIPKDTSGKIDEPFQSDRHQIDAESWFDLTDKVRFSSYTGSKSVSENFAFLPTTIAKVTDGLPQFAQWNYRILCHPLKNDLPTKHLHPINNDLSFRLPHRKRVEEMGDSSALRFHLNKEEDEHYSKGTSLLDDLMHEIPGKDNYPAELHDNSMFMKIEDIHFTNHTLLNTGYYHRYFKTNEKGAMGINSIHRGFTDAQLFVAQTSQEEIMPVSVHRCRRGRCGDWSVRYTYALPLEIIYMSPLAAWNPYDLQLQENPADVSAGGRNGALTPEGAYNGSTSRIYFRTPAEFFSPPKWVRNDPADTGGFNTGVLDKNGTVQAVAASGTRIVVKHIAGGVDSVRLRYPIMPIHQEGSQTGLELSALKEMTMKMNRYATLFEELPFGVHGEKPLHYRLKKAHPYFKEIDTHTHDFFFTEEELDELKKGKEIEIKSTETNGHSHELTLRWKKELEAVIVHRCDEKWMCPDHHPREPELVQDP